MSPQQTLRIFQLELHSELMKLLRNPGFILPAIGFPWMFYLLFGIAMPFGRGGGAKMAAYLLATYGVFGVLGACLFALGSNVAIERGQGWMLAKRAMPMPVALHFAARLVVAGLLGLVIAVGLAVFGAVFGGVRLPTSGWAELLAIVVVLSLPFGALGLIFGHSLGPSSAPAVINIIFLPLSFLSGLWIPVQLLPAALQRLAPALPPYHAAQLTLRLFSSQDTPVVGSVLYLVVFTAIAFAIALFAYRRDQG